MGKLTHTVSGNPVSFKSADKSNIESLKVYFSPIQEGTGDPSSSNVRPIYPQSTIKVRTLKDYIAIVPSNQQQIYYSTDNNYRLEYTSNGKFKLLDTINSEDVPIFNIDIVSITWPENANRLIAISNIKQSVGKWNFTFSLRNEASNNLNGYFEFATDPQALIVNVNDNSNIIGKTYTSIRLVFTSAITVGTEFALGITNSSNIIQHNIDLSNISAYGGYIDLITGTLVSNTIVFNLTGSEDYLTYQSNTHRLRIKDFNLTYGWSSVPPISNVFKTATDSSFSVYFATTSSGNQNLNLGFPSDYTEEQARNFIAQNNVQVVCKVSRTTTYQLTPQQLKTFCGQNNIWSNTNDDIEVTYEFTDHMAKRRLELNTPHIETISNIFNSFNTDLQAPLKECKVNFYPAQDTYATPSPTNAKTISGWNGVQLQKHNSLIPIIPDNFTTGQLGTSEGFVNYLGNNTYEFIGTAADGGSVLIPIQPIILEANTNYYVRIIKEVETGMNAVNIAMKTSDGTNIFVFRPNSIGWSNYCCGAYTNLENELTATTLAIGIPAGSTSFKFRFFLATSTFLLTTINWESTLGTIYGGYLDLTTGKLVKEWDYIDLSNLSFTYRDAAGGMMSYGSFATIYNCITPEYNHESAKAIAEKYKITLATTTDPQPGEFFISAKGNLVIFTNEQPTGKLVYKLTTPVEYQLTPQQIKTLKGTNNIWSNANGVVDIKYWTH